MIAARRELLLPFARLRTNGTCSIVFVLACTSDGGSTDPEKNIALFNVLKKARASGVPKANIESALQKVRVFVLFSYEKKNGNSRADVDVCFASLFFSLVVSISILGCGRRERRSGTADDVRGACAWLRRTYHVCMLLCPTSSSPAPPPFLCGVLTRERESLTDNGNRTLHQLREILNDHK